MSESSQELRLRPVFHQRGGRVEAHILLWYIAYVLLWCIEHTHRSHGGTLTGRRVLDTLGIRLPRKPRADKPPDLQLSLIDSGDQFSP